MTNAGRGDLKYVLNLCFTVGSVRIGPLFDAVVARDSTVAFEGVELRSSSARSVIDRRGGRHFRVMTRSRSVSMGEVALYEFDRVTVETSSVAEAVESANEFLTYGELVNGWLADSAYSRLQNTTDVTLLEALGHSTSHLPKINNGMPFPLNRDIVDVSRNPGREIMRMGFVEAVGTPMWLSYRFLYERHVAAADLARQLFGLASVTTHSSHVLVDCGRLPFSSSGTSDVLLQNRLRNAIYGTTV